MEQSNSLCGYRGTQFSDFSRTVKDFFQEELIFQGQKRLLWIMKNTVFFLCNAWIVRSQLMEQLNSQGPSCLCPKCLWTFLLGHTMNLCFPRRPPPTNGGLKCIIGLTWRTVAHHAPREWSGCLFRDETGDTRWLWYSLPNQTCRATDPCHRHRLVLFKGKMSILYVLVVSVLPPLLHRCGCYFLQKLKYCSHISLFVGARVMDFFKRSQIFCFCLHLK